MQKNKELKKLQSDYDLVVQHELAQRHVVVVELVLDQLERLRVRAAPPQLLERVAKARGPIGDRVVHHAHIRGVRVCVSLQCGLGQPRVRVLDPVEIERRGVLGCSHSSALGCESATQVLFRNF